jgi:hypothetical protein
MRRGLHFPEPERLISRNGINGDRLALCDVAYLLEDLYRTSLRRLGC